MNREEILSKLIGKHRLFVEMYTDRTLTSYGNGAEAARRAGYSEKSAKGHASWLMKQEKVVEAIGALKKLDTVKQEISKEDLLAEIWQNYKGSEGANKVKYLDMYVRLSGHLVEKKELKTEDVTDKVNNSVAEYIRGLSKEGLWTSNQGK